MRVYGLIHKDEEIRKHSTSGGAFSVLAEDILLQGGAVYGACFDENFHVLHRRITSINELSVIRGVKYVQSEIGDTYKQCRTDILQGKTVLFSGTPCQIAGLKNYLGKLADNDRLLLIDIICHGTPSPRVWEDYVAYLQKQCGRIDRIEFRDKVIYKWRDCKGTAAISDNHISIEDYAKLFYYHDIVRESCFSCPFASIHRQGDLTLGDFWGIENKHPDYDDAGGVSLVLCNTSRGEKYLENASERAIVFESDLKGCRQPQLYKPTRKPFTYEYFWRIYEKGGIDSVLKMIRNPHSMYVLLRKMEKTAKTLVKRVLGKA